MPVRQVGHQYRFDLPGFEENKNEKSGLRCYQNPIAVFFLKIFGKIIDNKAHTIHINKSNLRTWLDSHQNETFISPFLKKGIEEFLKNPNCIDILIKACEQREREIPKEDENITEETISSPITETQEENQNEEKTEEQINISQEIKENISEEILLPQTEQKENPTKEEIEEHINIPEEKNENIIEETVHSPITEIQDEGQNEEKIEEEIKENIPEETPLTQTQTDQKENPNKEENISEETKKDEKSKPGISFANEQIQQKTPETSNIAPITPPKEKKSEFDSLKDQIKTCFEGDSPKGAAEPFLLLLDILCRDNMTEGAKPAPNEKGKFSFRLKEVGKYWIPAETKLMKSWIPKGLVFLFGNDQNKEIVGVLDKENKKIVFENGFNGHALAKIGFFTKATTPTVKELVYNKKENTFTLKLTGVPMIGNLDVSFNPKEFLSMMRSGEKIGQNVDYEQYLANKK